MVNLNNLKHNDGFISRDILKKELHDYEIFRHYIDYDFKVNEVFSSPFREDNIPSFGIFRGKKTNELIYNDFILGGGDVFTFVKYYFKYNTWYETYSRIAIDFSLDDKYVCKDLSSKSLVKQSSFKKPEELTKNIDLKVTIRKWSSVDKYYWKQFGINLKTLKKYNVFPITHVFFIYEDKNKIIKTDKLAYCFIENKDGKKTYKIYQPKSKYKWFNNHDYSVWQGWEQLPSEGKDLIITKSLKDVMCIHDLTGMPSCSLQSETTTPKENIIYELKKRFNNIYLLYDNDFDKKENHGQIFGLSLCKKYNLTNIVIPTKYKCKDISDLTKKVGKTKAKQILIKLIKESEDLCDDDYYNGVPF